MIDRRTFLRLIPLGALLGGRLPRRTAAEAEPEAAARAAFDLMKRGDVDALIATLRPEGLARFRRTMQPLAEVADDEGEVCRYFGIEDMAELARLDDAGFFRAYWGGLMQSALWLREALEGAEVRTYGRVMEGRDTAHVLYRLAYESGFVIPILVPRVVTLHRLDDGWALSLGGGVEGMAPPAGGGPVPPPRVAGTTVEPLGFVIEKGETAHVVYRCRIAFEGGGRFTGMYAYGVHRDDPEWSLIRRRDLEALVPIIDQRHGLASLRT